KQIESSPLGSALKEGMEFLKDSGLLDKAKEQKSLSMPKTPAQKPPTPISRPSSGPSPKPFDPKKEVQKKGFGEVAKERSSNPSENVGNKPKLYQTQSIEGPDTTKNLRGQELINNFQFRNKLISV